MIDWLSFSLRYDGPGFGLQYWKREGWEAPLEPAGTRHLRVEGSWSSSIGVRSIGGRLYITGNPVKWLTGQNVVGTNDIRRLVELMYYGVIGRLNLPDCLHAERDLRRGSARLTRVDCTFAYDVGTDEEVVSWLEAMGRACHVRYRGRGHFDPGMCSLMYGLTQAEGLKVKASRRSTFKFYNKYLEMKVPGHAPTCPPEFRDTLDGIALGTVRGEACFRALELERLGKSVVRKWDETTAYGLHRSWIDRMEMADQVELESETVEALPRKLKAAYHLWKSGVDVRTVMSRASFYEKSRDLREHGIDISVPCEPASEPVKIIPVLRILEAKPIDERDHEELFWRMAAAA